MKLFQIASLCCSLLLLGGCVSNQTSSNEQWLNPPMAKPERANVQYEIQIARLSQLLSRSDLDDDLRAKMYFERGSYYDYLGLRNLAQLDFNYSLQLNPAQPAVFNSLGLFYTQIGDFDSAYEAFESTLELDPKVTAAIRNRAIALYYGNRIPLALEGMQTFYQQDPSDPYRVLWLYIIEQQQSPEKAFNNLQLRYQARNVNNDDWAWVLVALMLNDIPEEHAFQYAINTIPDSSNTVLAERLTEIYFYLAKRQQIAGDYIGAFSLYKLSLAQGVYDFIENRYAHIETNRIINAVQAMNESQVEQ
ncbi:lipoprotein NlpI [Vibrio hippocampi]|uniref:Lipoprotein NlpI n=1 Tax=Vibrio hippocampi TaxID=654686 RepID=A0ABN8DMH5_9VIBR|nr:lipoprotein NlpI [Vibrio hippocampi]CAH0526767.1 Lipoprotein NlpI [Vibrio hippocampi]